ncbi:hypothetical protein MLD38_025883 [Melastoma candidum]|uniref:Uncharacterized protein n=1 Tax=Melastoma candidum TaxID=119954 RepID=A0ACB9NX94_9MYRT|nr:hypothetical protein MLD38_025883 [Melastoma candidum]
MLPVEGDDERGTGIGCVCRAGQNSEPVVSLCRLSVPLLKHRYPDYLRPFHAYDDGNLSWPWLEAEAATLSMHMRAIPEAYSAASPTSCHPRDHGSSSGVEELSPVLFMSMKSTEPFLNKSYHLGLKTTIKDAGFIDVNLFLTDPRH